MGIILQNVGIFEEKFGGDKWGFLIAEMGILTQKILATLVSSMDECETEIISEFDQKNS